MVRLIGLFSAALFGFLSLPAFAELPPYAFIEAKAMPADSWQALPDAALASVYGTGIDRSAGLRGTARDNFESFGRVTSQTMPVIFDNWFNDVAAPLIVSAALR